MSPGREAVAWGLLLAALAALVAVEGSRRAALERSLPIAPRELYRTLARSQAAWQVLDVRPDPEEGFEEAHVPGAIPLPGCDPARAPPGAAERIHRSVPTVLVTADGEGDEVQRCLDRFTAARRLEGGMDAWSAALLPEENLRIVRDLGLSVPGVRTEGLSEVERCDLIADEVRAVNTEATPPS